MSTSEKSDLVSFLPCTDVAAISALREYIFVGDSIQNTALLKGFLDIADIMEKLETSIFGFICLSSGFGKSQLTFSIKDRPLLYFLSDPDAGSYQPIYKLFTQVSNELHKYAAMDIAQHFPEFSKESRKKDPQFLFFDYDDLVNSQKSFWTVGFIFSLITKRILQNFKINPFGLSDNCR